MSDPNRLRVPIYHSYQQLVEDLNQLRKMDSRNFVDQSAASIGQSQDGQWQIPVIKIGKNPGHRVFIQGGTHAREWISVEVPYLLAELLIKIVNDMPVHAFYNHYKDTIKQLLQEREVWIVPMLNPEGNTFSHQPGHQNWRKNRRRLEPENYTTQNGDTWNKLFERFGPNAGENHRGVADWQELAQANRTLQGTHGTALDNLDATLPVGQNLQIPVYGVDVNRNYPFQWNRQVTMSTFENGRWTFSQGEPDIDTHSSGYPGAEVASEYEVKAVIQLFNQAASENRPFKTALSYHNFAEIVLYPWGYQPNPTDRQAIVDFGIYMAGLINKVRSPSYAADIERAREQERNHLRSIGVQADSNFSEFWLRSAKRRHYMHGNPGMFAFGMEGGAFLDWAHSTWNGMPVYTIELSPRPLGTYQELQTRILPVFRENLPAALALIEYGVTQRKMQRRGKLYRCHLFSYGGPQTKGVVSQWAQNFDPVGDRTVLSGEMVELFSTIEGDVYPINEAARVRFDILEEDHFITGGRDDKIVSFLGDGVTAAPEGFTRQKKDTVFHRLSSGQTMRSYVERFKQDQNAYQDNILVIEEPQDDNRQFHLLTWWTAQRLEDFADSEFYFIVNVNDVFEDQSDRIIKVSSTAIPTGTSLEDKVRAALLRINEHLGTGITDWAVTDNEARAVLQILKSLDPRVLLKTGQRMRQGSSWSTFRSNLPSSDTVAQSQLSALEMRMDPSMGYLMPGDIIHLMVIAVSVGGRVGDPDLDLDFRVQERGVRLPLLSDDVPIVGLLPEEAANKIADAYIDRMILLNPIVKLKILERGLFYAGRGPVGEFEFTSSSRLDPNSPRVRRLRKREQFINYIEGVSGNDSFVLRAISFYLRWIEENFASEEFLTQDPLDHWNWALTRASEPPPTSPVMEFLALLRRMQIRMKEAPSEERRRIQETMGRYLGWLDLHQNDSNLSQHDPVDIWVHAWGRTIDEDFRRIRAATERRVREERRQAELEAHWQAAEQKLDQALQLMMTRVWQLPKPRTVRDPSRGVGYLIMPSEGERMVRDLMARGFLDDFMRRMREVEPGFADTTVEQDFLHWLSERPELRDALWLTQAYPAVEKFAIEREIPGWQIAVEVAVGFIPIVGQIVGAYVAISGEDLFGNPLSDNERAIIGATILLPAAGKLFRVGRATVTTRSIVRTYNLSRAEGRALFRATAKIKPGSIGDRLLRAAQTDIRAGRSIRDPERLRQLAMLLQDMGLTARATARALSATSRAARQLPRRVDQLDLARTIPNITTEQVQLLEQLGEDAWSRLSSYASRRTSGFLSGGASARKGAISSVKGKIAEELIPHSQEFAEALQRAQTRAAQAGIDPRSVQFVSNVMGQAPTPMTAGQFAELTDGMLVAVHEGKLRIFTIFESKSSSNLRALASRSGESLGQIGWDFERLTELPTCIDQPLRMSDDLIVSGRVFQPEEVIIGRQTTEWLGVAPQSFNLSAQQLQSIREGMPGFRLFHGPVDDKVLNSVAERILTILSQGQ